MSWPAHANRLTPLASLSLASTPPTDLGSHLPTGRSPDRQAPTSRQEIDLLEKISYTVLTLAMAGGVAVTPAGAASAAHCVEGGSPGFSYFGSEVASGEREAKDTKGASTCRETTGSPSERAPGQ